MRTNVLTISLLTLFKELRRARISFLQEALILEWESSTCSLNYFSRIYYIEWVTQIEEVAKSLLKILVSIRQSVSGKQRFIFFWILLMGVPWLDWKFKTLTQLQWKLWFLPFFSLNKYTMLLTKWGLTRLDWIFFIIHLFTCIHCLDWIFNNTWKITFLFF
jgi:hypothetical protein